jgi:sterol desaturase/sphingolipid hydroxylase (fatty acid hydroxylase superfamily)
MDNINQTDNNFNVNNLHYAWFSFWVTYWIFGTLFTIQNKTDQSKISGSGVSNKKLFGMLTISMIITFIWTFSFNKFLPTLIVRKWTLIEYIVLYAILLFIYELMNYHVHRLLHTKWFYKFHKCHHAYIDSVPLAGIYGSLVETIINNPLALMIIYKLFGFTHIETTGFSIFIALNAIKSHSDIKNILDPNTAWNRFVLILFDDSYHTVHHTKLNHNYGYSYIFDGLYGTYFPPNYPEYNRKYF